MTLLIRLILRHISRRRFQSILFVLGVALGVAVGVAIDLANASASRAFNLSRESLTGTTTHQIMGGPAGLPENLYPLVRDELGIQESAPVVESYVRAKTLGDQPLRMLGVDFFAENPFRNYLEVSRGSSQQSTNAFISMFAAQNPVVISENMAKRFDVSVGDKIVLSINAETYNATVVGLLEPNDTFTQQVLDDLILTNLSTAQKLLNLPDKLSRIDLILPDDYPLESIRAILPAGAALTTPIDESSALSQMTEAFELNLQALSLLALVVGVFLIYNTVSFSVVQRRPVIGILRSLGTTRRQIFVLVVGEALLLGTVGTILGLGLGVVMGRGTVSAISQTISDLYFRVNVQEVSLEPVVLIKGLVIGISASVFAAVVPALDAINTAPAGAVRRSDVEQKAQKMLPYVTAVGVVLIGIGLLLLRVSDNSVFWSFAALFSVIVGCALFTPIALILNMHMMRPLAGGVFGVVGLMAPRAVLRSISRTSIAVAALTLAVSTIVGVGVMIGSFRGTVQDWLENTIGADIFISPPSLTANRIVANVDPELVKALEAVDGVKTVAVVRSVDVNAPDYPDLPPVRVAAINYDIAQGQRRFAWNKAPGGDYRAALKEGFVVVTEPFAFHRDISEENNKITLLTDTGPQEFTVIGVYYDYGSDQGTALMDLEVYRSYFDDPYITSLALYVEDETNIQQVMNTLRTETLVGMDLEVQSNRELREGALEIFDRTFSITAALQVLAVIVAFIGILSALLALQLEHQREYGIMRANGMTPGQLRKFTLVQTGLMGLTSGILSIPLGMVLAFILIYVINVRSFGWTMDIAPVPQEFVQAMAVAIFASVAAGVYPAWRLSKLITASAIRGE